MAPVFLEELTMGTNLWHPCLFWKTSRSGCKFMAPVSFLGDLTVGAKFMATVVLEELTVDANLWSPSFWKTSRWVEIYNLHLSRRTHGGWKIITSIFLGDLTVGAKIMAPVILEELTAGAKITAPVFLQELAVDANV